MDYIIMLVVGLILLAVIAYIVRAKRQGVKCIGCPAGASCHSHEGKHSCHCTGEDDCHCDGSCNGTCEHH